MIEFRPGQRLYIPGVRVVQPRVSAAAFTGPYDGITFAALYGMRRLLTSYTGNLIKLRRSSDNAELDFGYVANGDVDATAIATWLGGNSGFITTWYDQSGNTRNATQTSTANQPQYLASGINSKPTIHFDAKYLTASFSITQSAFSVLYCARRVARVIVTSEVVFSAVGANDYNSADRIVWSYQPSNDEPGLIQTYRANAARASKTHPGTNTNFIFSGTLDGTNSRMYINGGTPASAASSGALNASLVGIACRLDSVGPNAFAKVYMTELALLPAAISAGDHNTIGNNLATYFGLTWTNV